MIAVTAAERAAVKWLAVRGIRVSEATQLLTYRLSVRRGKSEPGAFTYVFVTNAVLVIGVFGYQVVPWLDRADLPDAGVPWFVWTSLVLTNWLQIRAGDRRAVAWLGDERLIRPRPPWREVVNGWYAASLAVTFGGGAVLAVTMVAGGSVWARFWLGAIVLGAAVEAVVLTSIVRRPVIAEDEGSLAVDTVTRLQDVHCTVPSLFAVPVLVDLGYPDLPGKAWLAGYVALAVTTHVIGYFAQRRRVPPLPPGARYGPGLSGSTPS
ncbi:hypothetical protein H4696_008004 [Amycolatopsis lexingtonensis]|uniref:ABC transporter permease n=1 Tax=Amycolatopsis lexingtonensis TaxID=218822 RepID=A0ABR9ICJ7_9PSEU|nr:hypothetical protein [Amycolatopsis lexingtonensis]MBE1500904.1 hypothetical protein [Amycolatopsis lexingtonensis]